MRACPFSSPCRFVLVENQHLVADPLHAVFSAVSSCSIWSDSPKGQSAGYAPSRMHTFTVRRFHRWRGAYSALTWAGDETGVTIMQRWDVGWIPATCCITRCPITAEDTSGSLYNKLAELGPAGLITTPKQLADLAQRRPKRRMQRWSPCGKSSVSS